jgi:hypothetical protein
MTDTSTDLIARLTAATGLDVELDVAIEMAINPIQIAAGDCVQPPAYTGTFEDALKSVPDGWRFYSLTRATRERWVAAVEITNNQLRFRRCWFKGTAASAPLAICIAAMKARVV